MSDYLHNHSEFTGLLAILENETGIQAGLIEKDYWIMHVLYGLKKQGFDFNLKGGTSLSKGYKIIDRFSEDIDIYIKSPKELQVSDNFKSTKTKLVQLRKDYFDWLANNIGIDVVRDHSFDDKHAYRNGGIRLIYNSVIGPVQGVKDGILLEAGFDTVTPSNAATISSWAFDKADSTVPIIDNIAIDISCYHPGYTFVEKLQTIATKFGQEQESGQPRANLLRQYYDVYSLLGNQQVQDFIGTNEYVEHKKPGSLQRIFKFR